MKSWSDQSWTESTDKTPDKDSTSATSAARTSTTDDFSNITARTSTSTFTSPVVNSPSTQPNPIPNKANVPQAPLAPGIQNSYPYPLPYPIVAPPNAGPDQGPVEHLPPNNYAQGQGQNPSQPQVQGPGQPPFVQAQPFQLPQMAVPEFPVHSMPPQEQWDQYGHGYPPQQYPQQRMVPIQPGGNNSPGFIRLQPPYGDDKVGEQKKSKSRKSSVSGSSDSTTPPGGGSKPVTKRSRMGCLTCRQRKKRCCENRPKCHECKRLGLNCVWPKPGTEHKNKPKDVKNEENTIEHEIYGKIKVLRGIVEYRSK